MTAAPDPRLPVTTAREVLQALVARGQAEPQRAWVALDLDGTLFDNRPRTLAILRAFAMARREHMPDLLPAIQRLSLDDLHYSPGQAVDALGLPHANLSEAFVQFWQERFFTNAWQALDAVETGAVAFAHALVQAGLGVVYLTGRDRPGMLQGVMQALDGHGFPLATAMAQVVLKPDFRTTDLLFKREALTELQRNGPVVGLIDNEPAIVNMAMEELPGLVGVRICRPAAPDPPPLAEGALQIASFVL
jgi:phosphoglycolate phosphatase-like HAD superfamily hydrolase